MWAKISLLGFALACTSALYPQTSTATLQGVAHDPSGAAVPQAKVIVKNMLTGVINTVDTNQEGRYVVPFLQPGSYEVVVEKTGFRRFAQSDIKLEVQQNRSIDMGLTLGDLASVVEVTSAAPPLDTNSATVMTNIENKSIEDLPVTGREVLSLAQLVPGVTQVLGGAGSLPQWYSPQIGGGRAGQSEVLVDGATLSISDPTSGTSAYGGHPPSIDAVQEFTVQVNALAPEFGRTTGGVINVVTKQGTNAIHGVAREFLQNDKLNANDFFANRAGIPMSPYKHNDFGFSLGGPIYVPHAYDGRNRSFFFVDWEHQIFRQPSVSYATVPISAWKNGNFTGLMDSSGAAVTLYDPTAIHQDASGNWTRNSFAGNIIPLTRFDPVAQKVMSYYPEPNTASTNPYTPVNNFYKALTGASNFDSINLRLDHNFSDTLRTYVRLDRYVMIYPAVDNWGNKVSGSSDNPIHRYSGVWDNTYALNPTTVINLHYGLSRFANLATNLTAGFDSTSLGLPDSLHQQAGIDHQEFPSFDIGDLAGMGGGWSMRYFPTTHNISASITKVKSAHTIKMGVEYKKFLLNFWQSTGCPNGCFGYARDWTSISQTSSTTTQGLPFASFLLGLGSGFQSNSPAQSLASSSYGSYFQDEWHVSKRLTINIGTRYDVDTPKTERYNRMSYFDISAASPIAGVVPGYANLVGAMRFANADHRQQTPTDWNNVGPRFGFSYQVFPSTVIRGGYGLMYGPSPMQAGYHQAGFEGFRTSTTMITSLDNRTPLNYLRDPFPNGFQQPLGATSGPYSGANTNLGKDVGESYFLGYVNPVIQQWNFNIQHSLPQRMVIEVGYLGQKGNHLQDGEPNTRDQLDPKYMTLGNSLFDLVSNPFYGVITDPASPLSQPTVQRRQLLAPYPQYTSLNPVRAPIGNSIYHAITIRLEKRFSNSASFLLAYTGAKSISDGELGGFYAEGGDSSRQNVYDRRSDRSLSTQDVSSRFVISGTYELPVGRGHRFLSTAPSAVNAIFGGWQANGVVTLQTGLPIPIYQVFNNTGIGTAGQRPNSNGQSAAISGGSTDQRINQWFNVNDFTIAQPFTFGNAPRTLPDVREPGLRNCDLSIFKNFRLFGDKVKAQFRAEAFNALNTPQFARANSSIGSSGAGTINSLRVPARQAQLALKLIF